MSYGEYYNEGQIDCPLFNQKINISVDFDVESEYAEKCIKHFQSLSIDLTNLLYQAIIKYCDEYLEEFKEEYKEEKIDI